MLASHESDKHKQSLAGIMKAQQDKWEGKSDIFSPREVNQLKTKLQKPVWQKVRRWFSYVTLQGKAYIDVITANRKTTKHVSNFNSSARNQIYHKPMTSRTGKDCN